MTRCPPLTKPMLLASAGFGEWGPEFHDRYLGGIKTPPVGPSLAPDDDRLLLP